VFGAGKVAPFLVPCAGMSLPTDRVIERGHQDQVPAPGLFTRIKERTFPFLSFIIRKGDDHVLAITPLLSPKARHDPVDRPSSHPGSVVLKGWTRVVMAAL